MSVYIYRLSQWIEKKFNAKGGQVITDFDQTAQAQLSWAVGVEDRYLQGWNRFGGQGNSAAVAAQFGQYKLRNPVGSNVIGVLESANFLTTLADGPAISWGASTTDLANIVSLTFSRIDPRGNPQPTLILSQGTAAANPSPAQYSLNIGPQANAGGNGEFVKYPDIQWVILPGQAIEVNSVVANQANSCCFLWREKALELSELT